MIAQYARLLWGSGMYVQAFHSFEQFGVMPATLQEHSGYVLEHSGHERTKLSLQCFRSLKKCTDRQTHPD